MRARVWVWLRLGRVSNLPTVWSNALAGALLAAHDPERAITARQALPDSDATGTAGTAAEATGPDLALWTPADEALSPVLRDTPPEEEGWLLAPPPEAGRTDAAADGDAGAPDGSGGARGSGGGPPGAGGREGADSLHGADGADGAGGMDGAEDLTFAGASADALGGAAAAGGGAASIALAALALSLFYLGGMWLNDAFDAEVDARERADRPIPRGEIARGTVFAIGFAMLAGGVALAAMLGPGPGAAGALLAVAVILYDWLHKRMATAPLLMGAARMLSYGVAALAVGALTGAVLGGAAGLFAYVVGLTFAARQEALDRLEGVWPLAVLAVPVLYAGWRVQGAEDPLGAVLLLGLLALMVWALWLLFRRRRGDVPRAVDTLIGGIALYDAVLLAAAGYPGAAALAAGAFALTLALQRWVPGT